MKKRLIAWAGALVTLATGAALAGLVRPVHLWAAPPPPDPSAPRMVSVTPPKLPSFPQPPDAGDFTEVEPEPPRPKRNMAAAERIEPELPPLPDIVAVPRVDAPLPPVASMLPARSGMPDPASMLPAPAPAPQAPADPNGVFRELPGEREQPEIRVFDRSGLPGALIIRGGTFARRWTWNRTGRVVADQIPPGEYEYEILGPESRFTGEPDIAGTLRCRKQKLYEVRLRLRSPDDPSGTIHQDLGDD